MMIVRRFFCKSCKKWFSSQTLSVTFRQKKIRILYQIKKMLVSGVSRRQIARVLRTTRKTVERKIKILAQLVDKRWESFLKAHGPFDEFEFDEMETFEHTKCKPLSIPLVVSKKRLILGIGLAQMPAKGLLAKISRKKYGPRKDERGPAIDGVLLRLKPFIRQNSVATTDEKTTYPGHLKKFWPDVVHKTTPGGRGCIVGHGELKKKGFDPMFALNHTAAMIRDHLATLKRRTWTTTKKPENLLLLLKIYAASHNHSILNR